MKKFICLFALVVISLFATVSVKAIAGCGGQYYIVSDVYNIGGTVYGYSATELDYCAGLYNDPIVSGIFLENTNLIGQGYVEGYANQIPAIVNYAYSAPVAGQTYTTLGDHYVIAYYQVYVPMWNDWFWYDPGQLGFMEAGGGYEAPGYYGFSYAYYWFSQYIYIGTTTDSMTYCGQTQCQPGQQFSPTGVSCNFVPTVGSCGEDPSKPKLTLQSVGFKNDHDIKRIANDTVIAKDNNGNDEPTWIKGRGDNDKYPVAYTKDNTPVAFAKISVSNANPSFQNATVQVKENGTVRSVIPNINISSNGDIILNSVSLNNLPYSNQVGSNTYDLTWEVSFDGSNWSKIGNSEHKIHWLFLAQNEIPIFGSNLTVNTTQQPFQTLSGLFDVALEHSTGAIGTNGSNDVNVIAEKITKHIPVVLNYDPGRPRSNRNPLEAFTDGNKFNECSDNSAILVALLHSVGIKNERTDFHFGGNPGTKKANVYLSELNYEVSAQFERDAIDNIEKDPHFIYHSTVNLNGIAYDASYGKVGINIITAVSSSGNCVRGVGANFLRFEVPYISPAGDYFLNACRTFPGIRKPLFISQSIPSDIQVGQNSSVLITLQNDGSDTWRASEGYQLGSQSPTNNFTWGLNRVSLPHDVAPGQQVTFSFNITAPINSGFYNFQWQMLQNGEWFGDSTPNIPIEVIGSVECSSGDQQSCYWQGGYWNQQTCTCEGIY